MNETDLSPSPGRAGPVVQFSPAPDWVVQNIPEVDPPQVEGTHVCTLFADWQHDAAEHITFHRSLRRLESMLAVQALSQWRLPFDARTQEVRLHWIRLRRGDSILDQGHPNRIRVLQREEGLDRFVIDGWWTVLVLLEDVRPKDVLDVAYSVQLRPTLLPENTSLRFHLPTSEPLSRYRIRFLHRRKSVGFRGGWTRVPSNPTPRCPGSGFGREMAGRSSNRNP